MAQDSEKRISLVMSVWTVARQVSCLLSNMVAERRHDEMGVELIWGEVKSLDGRRPTSTTKVRSNLGDAERTQYAREYLAKMEVGLQEICDDILILMDTDLISSGSPGEPEEREFAASEFLCLPV